MKVIIAAIAALSAISAFTGSAIADVSINLSFGSSPSYRRYNSYRSNVYQNVYPRVPHYQNNYYDRYNRNVNSSVIVREVYPSSYRNSWYQQHRDSYQADRYIIEKRIIRVR